MSEKHLVKNKWVKGFEPSLAKCVVCRGQLVFTGRYTTTADHVYRCRRCGASLGSSTQYARCDLSDTSLQKDGFFTPCIDCKERKVEEGHGVCVHWDPEDYSKLPLANKVEDAMKRFRVI